MVTAKVESLQKQLDAEVRFVSISIDPERDVPQKLKEYGARFNADSSRWTLLTGEKPVINNLLANVFFLGNLQDKNVHSTRLALVDGKGVVRGFYDSNDEEAIQRLVADVETLPL